MDAGVPPPVPITRMTIIVEIYMFVPVFISMAMCYMYGLDAFPSLCLPLGLARAPTQTRGRRRHNLLMASLHYPVLLHPSASSSVIKAGKVKKKKKKKENRRERTHDTLPAVSSCLIESCPALSPFFPSSCVWSSQISLGLLAKSVANSPVRKDRPGPPGGDVFLSSLWAVLLDT